MFQQFVDRENELRLLGDISEDMGFDTLGKRCLPRSTWLFYLNDGRLHVRLSRSALRAEDGTTSVTAT